MNGDPYNSAGPKTNVVKLGVKPRAAEKPDFWRVRKIVRLALKNVSVRIDPVQVAGATLEKAKAGPGLITSNFSENAKGCADDAVEHFHEMRRARAAAKGENYT